MDPFELHRLQRQAILDGETEAAVDLARQALAAETDLQACLDQGYIAGIQEVGRLWEEGEYFLPELVQGADAMKAALDLIRPALAAQLGDKDLARGAKIVLGTVAGDIHDIGKTLVATVLAANGFTVVDLGRDVSTARFVDAVNTEAPAVLGLSALLTTTMSAQAEVIAALSARGLRDRVAVMVGGAPVTPRYANDIGADGYASSAMDALALARRLVGA